MKTNIYEHKKPIKMNVSKKAITILTICLLAFAGTQTAQAQVMSNGKCYVQMALRNAAKNDAEKDKPLIIFLSDVLEVSCLNGTRYRESYRLDFQLQFFKYLYENYPEKIKYFNVSNFNISMHMEDSKEKLLTYMEKNMGYDLHHPDSKYEVIKVKDFQYQPMMFVPEIAFTKGKYNILKEPDAKKRELYRKWLNIWLDLKKK